MVIATVGAAIAAIAAFLPMVDAWDSGERLSMWNLMSTRDYESSGLSDITGVLVVVIPVVLTVALAGLMVLGSATAFRATSAAMAASSVMWLVWLTAWVSWWVDGWQADFNAVRWLLMLGPVLSLIAGVVGLVSVSRVQHVAPVPAPRVTPAPA